MRFTLESEDEDPPGFQPFVTVADLCFDGDAIVEHECTNEVRLFYGTTVDEFDRRDDWTSNMPLLREVCYKYLPGLLHRKWQIERLELGLEGPYNMDGLLELSLAIGCLPSLKCLTIRPHYLWGYSGEDDDEDTPGEFLNARAAANILRYVSQIEHLDMVFPTSPEEDVEKESIKQLCQALGHHPSLQSVHLRMDPSYHTEFDPEVEDAIASIPNLREFSLCSKKVYNPAPISFRSSFFSRLISKPTMQNFQIFVCNISADCFAASLVSRKCLFLSNLTRLELLDLDCTGNFKVGTTMFSRLSNLHELTLGFSSLSRHNGQTLAGEICGLESLETLHIEMNVPKPVNHATLFPNTCGLAEMISGLRGRTKELQNLGLSNAYWTREMCEALQTGIANGNALDTFYICADEHQECGKFVSKLKFDNLISALAKSTGFKCLSISAYKNLFTFDNICCLVEQLDSDSKLRCLSPPYYGEDVPGRRMFSDRLLDAVFECKSTCLTSLESPTYGWMGTPLLPDPEKQVSLDAILAMNAAGRKHGETDAQHFVKVLLAGQNSLDCLFRYIRANPAMFDRKGTTYTAKEKPTKRRRRTWRSIVPF